MLGDKLLDIEDGITSAIERLQVHVCVQSNKFGTFHALREM